MNTEHAYKPVRFFVITFLITWPTLFVAAYFSRQQGMDGVQLVFMVPSLFAPFIASLIMMSGAKNKALRKDFRDRLRLGKIKPGYLPATFLIMPFALLVATALSLIFGRSADQFKLSREFTIMEGQVLLSVLIMILAPTLEELGWRGYGVDSLRNRFGLFKTTMLFAVLWGLWHVPLFFIKGYYQNELWNTGIIYVINFFVQVLAATFLMNWMYYKNDRSIAAAIVFHFTFVFFSELLQTEQFTKCIITIILVVISVVIIIRNRGLFFEGKGLNRVMPAAPSS